MRTREIYTLGDVFDVIKLEKGLSSDGKLAKELGTTRQNISNRKNTVLGDVDKRIFEYLFEAREGGAEPGADAQVSELKERIARLEAQNELLQEQNKEKDRRIEEIVSQKSRDREASERKIIDNVCLTGYLLDHMLKEERLDPETFYDVVNRVSKVLNTRKEKPSEGSVFEAYRSVA